MNLGTYDKQLANRLDTKSVDMWILHADAASDFVADDFQSWLSAPESRRCGRLHLARHRRRYVLGQVMLRTILSNYVNKLPQSLTFKHNRYGKPEIDGGTTDAPPFFNLSRSDKTWVLAVSRHPLTGVDIEHCPRPRRIERIARRHYSEAETTSLLALPEASRLDRFYNLWTLKEAYLKALGLGLTIPLWEFEFGFDAKAKSAFSFRKSENVPDDAARWQFWQFEPPEHRIALAVSSIETEPVQHIQAYQLESLQVANFFDLQPTRTCLWNR